uniref:Uncharacterized protein n=1 Tax=Corvus moneduloides TaxID=1196302 RepID=A0A8C3DKE8_CORMO
EEGRNEGYSRGLQLPDREKSLEFEPAKPVYFSETKMKMEEEGKAPVFLKRVANVEVWQGDVARLSVTVTGSPIPKIQWFFNSMNEQLFSDARHSIAHYPDGSGSLTVWDCREEDTGLYTCRAVSALGNATCSAELFVLLEEHAVWRQSPALQHSAVAEDQSPLFYEEATNSSVCKIRTRTH